MLSSVRYVALLVPLMFLSGHANAQAERDLAQEEENRRIVVEFYTSFFQDEDLTAAERFIREDYIQHNPGLPDGRAPLVELFERIFASNPDRQNRILRSGTDGDLVFLHVHSQSNPDDRGRVIAEVFRVEDGMIAEHWDVMQEIPETAENDNGML